MPSDGGGLLGPRFAGSGADRELTDRALAVASARIGVVPDQAAAAIAAACQADRFDPDDLGRLLGPDGYLGAAERLMDRGLTTHRGGGGAASPSRRRRGRGTRLGYELSGPEQAPVLVLANSMGTTMAMWDDQLPDLSRHLRVLRYDHRGHGTSEAPPGPYRIEQLAADLLGLLDDLDLEQVSFCGLSLGGMVGMWLAANAPDRIDRLALCCTSAKVDPDPYLERAAKVLAGGTGSIVDEVVERWFTAAFRQAAPRTVAKAVAMLAATSDEGYTGCCEAIAAMDLRADLPAISAPTLVIAGADDPATPPPHAEAIVAGIAGARLEMITGAAHLANIQQPQRITRLLLDHLADPTAR